MTHPLMRSRAPSSAVLALVLGLASAGLTGCSTVQPWAHGGTDHPTQAGGSVRVPFAVPPQDGALNAGSCTEPRGF